MKFKRIVSAVLVLVMTVASFSACSSNKRNSNVISADSTWFDTTEVEIATQYQSSEYTYVNSSLAGMTDEGIVLVTNATLQYPENATDVNYSDYERYYVDYYSLSGETISSVCLNNAFSEICESSEYGYVSYMSLSPDGDVITLEYEVYDSYYSSLNAYAVDVNLADGSYNIRNSDDSVSDDEYSWYSRYPDYSYEGEMEVEDYSIYKFWINEGDFYSYILIVVDPNGEEVVLDLRDEFADLSIFDISTAIKISENEILLSASPADVNDAYFVYDISNQTITDVSETYSWLEDVNLWGIVSYDGVGCFVFDSTEGVLKLDFDNQTCETFMSFTECNVNINTISNMSIVNATADSVTLAGAVYANNDHNDVYKVVTFTRADSNPNAGKTILKAASMDGYSNEIYESIYRFNNTSETCYMILDDRYSVNESISNLDYSDYDNWEDYEAAVLNSYATLGDQLTVDIIAGEGPDILFDATSLTQLNNPDYLVDLSDMVTGDSYFTNVFEACYTDGALYQLPLSISTVGITTTTEYVDPDQVGFTFEEYLTFVDEVCNGSDPIKLSKTEYFTILHAAMNDLFREGNTVNYDCDAFRALASYIKNDVVEYNFDEEIEVYSEYDEAYETPKARYGGVYSISSFFDTYGDRVSEVRVLGVPSYDGRGPQFTIDKSVAVSAQSYNIDGCREFVSIMLGEDIQTLMAKSSWSTPVNKNVLISIGEDAVAEHNANVDMYQEWYTAEELQMYNLSTQHLDNSAIDYYVAIIEGCTTCATVDVAIDLIIREEMQAYYADQKDINVVIDTMSNRINTYINERG